jgi:hypothetical protein
LLRFVVGRIGHYNVAGRFRPSLRKYISKETTISTGSATAERERLALFNELAGEQGRRNRTR